jgi:hypothetical protein
MVQVCPGIRSLYQREVVGIAGDKEEKGTQTFSVAHPVSFLRSPAFLPGLAVTRERDVSAVQEMVRDNLDCLAREYLFSQVNFTAGG